MVYIILLLVGCLLFTVFNVIFLINLNKKYSKFNLEPKKMFKTEYLYTILLFIVQFIIYVFSISFIHHVVFYLFIGLSVLISITILSFIGEMNTNLKVNKVKDKKRLK